MELGRRVVRNGEPAGFTRSLALTCSRNGESRLGYVDYPYWHLSDNALKLKKTRSESALTLREAARLLGMTASQLTGLETGASVLQTEADWLAAIAAIEQSQKSPFVVAKWPRRGVK
jgi:Helix-turn-helix domain